MKTVKCWEFNECGREKGGARAEEFGVCPAYPDNGNTCARVAGTFCGGKMKSSFASKLQCCLKCEFYHSPYYNRDYNGVEISGSQSEENQSKVRKPGSTAKI